MQKQAIIAKMIYALHPPSKVYEYVVRKLVGDKINNQNETANEEKRLDKS